MRTYVSSLPALESAESDWEGHPSVPFASRFLRAVSRNIANLPLDLAAADLPVRGGIRSRNVARRRRLKGGK
jgi:hypothetical protein